MVPCIYNIATTIAMPNLTYQNQNMCSKKTKKLIIFITFHTFIQLISFVEHESNAIDSLFWQVGHAWDTLAKLQIGSDKNVHINSTLHSFQRHGRRKNHEVLKIIHKLIESTEKHFPLSIALSQPTPWAWPLPPPDVAFASTVGTFD